MDKMREFEAITHDDGIGNTVLLDGHISRETFNFLQAALQSKAVTSEELANFLDNAHCEMEPDCGGRKYFEEHAQAILTQFNVTKKE